jgi:serine/threonine protein kinase
MSLLGQLPQAFDRFRVYEQLGQGGMGTAFRAVDPVRGREVVLKFPNAGLEGRFEWEARIGQALTHPGCCLVEEYHPRRGPDGLAYTVMPYLRGGTLEVRLKAGRFGPQEAARLVRSLARTLVYVHGQNVIHRDIKPGNVLFIAPEDDEPVLADFGLAVRLDEPEQWLPGPGEIEGTRPNLSPQQRGSGDALIGPGCDIWALGIVLYQLLSGRHPFIPEEHSTVPYRPAMWDLFMAMGAMFRGAPAPNQPPVDCPLPPLPADIPSALAEACLRALAHDPRDRFARAHELAAAMDAFLMGRPQPTPGPPVPPSEVRLEFVPYGTRAPDNLTDTLYLDVGGDLRPGVIDHHHLQHYPGSTASMLAHRLDLVALAQSPHRPAAPFTMVLHRHPDLDALGSAYLARRFLMDASLPAHSRALCSYLDEVDAGRAGWSPGQPYTLYTAFRILLESEPKDEAGWRRALTRGFAVLDHVLSQAPADVAGMRAIDAFEAPGVFRAGDRAMVDEDRARYERKATGAKKVSLWLPRQGSPRRAEVPALLARDVQNEGDPERCLFFKDWARADAERAGTPPGFVALCVFMSRADKLGRAIISVTPKSRTSLRGLGRLLEAKEREKRLKEFGRDSRDFDAAGARKPPRYAERGDDSSADPWYDGRAHDYTIVDGPASGSVLTVDEIEALVCQFGERPPHATSGV